MALSKDKIKSVFQKANSSVKEMGQPIPPAKYFMKLISCKCGQSKKGAEMVTTTWEVLEGEYTGRKHFIYNMIDNEVSMSIMFGHWRSLGYDTTEIDSMEDLQQYCDAISSGNHHAYVRIAQNTKNADFVNTYIDQVVVQEEEEEAEPVATEPEEVPEEPESDDDGDDDEEAEIDVGSKIKYSSKGKILTGEVKELHPDEGFVVLANGKTKVLLSSITEVL